MKRLARLIDGYVMAPAPAERLGALRVLVGGFAMIYLVARLPHLLSYAHVAHGHFKPVGPIALLDAPLPPWLWMVATCATAALSIPFFLGLGARVVGPIFALLLLFTISYRNSFGMVFHTENLLVIHVLILGFTPSADAWSLDGMRARRHGRPDPEAHAAYGWPVKLMAWVLVIAYVLAGVAKLRNGGFEWMLGDHLRNHVALDNARKMLLGDFYSPLAAPLVDWRFMWRALATITVIAELCAPIALLGARYALAWVACVMGFHWGVLVLMMIVFPYQMAGVAFACLFPVERLGERVHARWRRFRERRASPR